MEIFFKIEFQNFRKICNLGLSGCQRDFLRDELWGGLVLDIVIEYVRFQVMSFSEYQRSCQSFVKIDVLIYQVCGGF